MNIIDTFKKRLILKYGELKKINDHKCLILDTERYILINDKAEYCYKIDLFKTEYHTFYMYDNERLNILRNINYLLPVTNNLYFMMQIQNVNKINFSLMRFEKQDINHIFGLQSIYPYDRFPEQRLEAVLKAYDFLYDFTSYYCEDNKLYEGKRTIKQILDLYAMIKIIALSQRMLLEFSKSNEEYA